MVYAVEVDTHSAASQFSNESVDPLYKELVATAADQWRSNVDFAEMGVGTARREFGVTYSRMCFAQLG